MAISKRFGHYRKRVGVDERRKDQCRSLFHSFAATTLFTRPIMRDPMWPAHRPSQRLQCKSMAVACNRGCWRSRSRTSGSPGYPLGGRGTERFHSLSEQSDGRRRSCGGLTAACVGKVVVGSTLMSERHGSRWRLYRSPSSASFPGPVAEPSRAVTCVAESTSDVR
jgi:hypothetical protein